MPCKDFICDVLSSQATSFDVVHMMTSTSEANEILQHFDVDSLLLKELARIVSCENVMLLTYLCNQHDVEPSLPAVMYLIKRRLYPNAPSLIDLESVISLISDDIYEICVNYGLVDE